MIFKKTVLAAVIVGSFAINAPCALATGFPTVDIVANIQAVIRWGEELETKNEMIQNTIHTAETMKKAVEEAQAIQAKIDDAKNNLEYLKTTVSDKDWEEAFLTAKDMYRNKPFTGDDLRRLNMFKDEKEAEEREFGEIDNERSMKQDAKNEFGYVPDNYEESYKDTNRSLYQRKSAENFRKENVANQKNVEKIGKARKRVTGDPSELKELQTLVEQNQILITQMTTQNRILQAQFETEHLSESKSFFKDQKRKQAALKKAKYNRLHKVKVSNKPFKL